MTLAGWPTLTLRTGDTVGRLEKERVNGEKAQLRRARSHRMSDEALDRG